MPGNSSATRRLQTAGICLGLAIFGSGCSEKTNTLTGKALGTTWTVKVRTAQPLDPQELRSAIATTIEEAEAILSHWRPDAELYQFNQALTSAPLAVHPLLHDLLLHARRVHADSAGAFDPTIAPLVNLWGFGPVQATRTTLPTAQEIQQAKTHLGMGLLEILPRHQVRKRQPAVQADLSGSAKGAIIDRVCAMLESRGLDDHLVEIGGELRAGSGNWKIALEDGTLPPGDLAVLQLQDSAVATSGSYRLNKRGAQSDKPASHLLDPRTGHPVQHEAVAVNVIAPTARDADAWATALLVLGPEEGLKIAKARNIAVRFCIQTGDANIQIVSPAYELF